MPGPTIRLATLSDLPAINDIYNHYVLHSTCTYQEEPTTAAEREVWFLSHGPLHPITVADAGAEVLAWASLSPFHTRSAYRRTVENSVYVRHDVQRQGIGMALLVDSVERARTLGHHTIVSLIDREQAASVNIHQRLGFQQVAHLKEVGFKLGHWLDVVYLQKML
jgi:L-amino acid N-acyltransferase YncA